MGLEITIANDIWHVVRVLRFAATSNSARVLLPLMIDLSHRRTWCPQTNAIIINMNHLSSVVSSWSQTQQTRPNSTWPRLRSINLTYNLRRGLIPLQDTLQPTPIYDNSVIIRSWKLLKLLFQLLEGIAPVDWRTTINWIQKNKSRFTIERKKSKMTQWYWNKNYNSKTMTVLFRNSKTTTTITSPIIMIIKIIIIIYSELRRNFLARKIIFRWMMTAIRHKWWMAIYTLYLEI
jgi:hypothetical protein